MRTKEDYKSDFYFHLKEMAGTVKDAYENLSASDFDEFIEFYKEKVKEVTTGMVLSIQYGNNGFN